MESYLGIDGGGTKTRALLVDAKGHQLHYAESGPGNLNACGPEVVRDSLSDILGQCIQTTGETPSATCLGLAGAGDPAVRKKLETLIRSLGLPNSRIVSDAEIALHGAFDVSPGILLIAGTGSVCLGKDAKGSTIQCGGWGWLADDCGSAGWIGQRALETALKQNDGRLDGHLIRDAVFKHLGIDCSQTISSKIYHPLLSRSQIAGLSKYIFELAERGDGPAREIYNQALDELESLVRATTGQIHESTHPLALTGGLIQHHTVFRQALESRLADFKITKPQSTQLDGAVALARELVRTK